MTEFILATNVMAVQTAPQGFYPVPGGITISQTIMVMLSGIGECSVTVQPVATNNPAVDNPIPGNTGSWVNYGPALTIAGNPDTGQVVGSISLTQNWTWFGAIVTAISGTGAAATVVMNA